MKILHTADWHIGQTFYAYDRTFEQEAFLNWLVKTLKQEAVDVLLVSGDIFDTANPSAASQKLFYRFLKNAEKCCPDLQMIITAGNHDSAARLESPKPLLESSNIHIVGLVSKDNAGNIDYDKLCIPLKGTFGKTEAWCLAIPFLRLGDYPMLSGAENTYVAGVSELYQEAFAFASQRAEEGQPILAMGHLHAQNVSVSDMDQQERLIMGGVEGIPLAAFPQGLTYVALGHIHKAQRVGGKENIRYSGSPIPMSFSERHYKHQVFLFDMEVGAVKHLKSIEIPVSIPLKRVPEEHKPFAEALFALEQLPLSETKDWDKAPYLEVCILAEGPEPGIRHKVEKALEGKFARLAKIDVRYRDGVNAEATLFGENPEKLEQLKPMDIFEKTYQTKYGVSVPEVIRSLFQQSEQKVGFIE